MTSRAIRASCSTECDHERHQIHFTNYSCFADRELQLKSRFNLIVGDNGRGKTSILNGVSVGIGSLFLGFPEPAKVRGIEPAEVHRKFYTHGQSITTEPQFPCIVECNGGVADATDSWSCQRDSTDADTTWQGASWIKATAQSLQSDVQDGKEVVLPAIAYYGTGRLWVQLERSAVKTLSPESRFAGYLDCLNPASNDNRLIEWFKTQELIALQQKTSIDVLESCRQVIRQCIPDCEHVFFEVSRDELILRISGDDVPFTYLSDGFRNMLAMATDLAVKCATLNPHLRSDAAAQTPGVVLIDEIDLHLHPKWQRRVVDDLMRAFEQIQFVATTHLRLSFSPFQHPKACN